MFRRKISNDNFSGMMTNGTEIGNDLISSKHYPMKNVTFGSKTHTHKKSIIIRND